HLHLVAWSAWVADPSQAQDDISACVGPETYETLHQVGHAAGCAEWVEPELRLYRVGRSVTVFTPCGLSRRREPRRCGEAPGRRRRIGAGGHESPNWRPRSRRPASGTTTSPRSW